MSLMGAPLMVVLVALSVLAPIGLAVLWTRHRRRAPRTDHRSLRRVSGVLTLAAAIIVCQATAIFTVGVVANHQYGFYSSWSDLLGISTAQNSSAEIITAQPLPPGQGTMKQMVVPGSRGNASQKVLVWLPPDYRRLTAQHHRLPVLLLLTGQPGSPRAVFHNFDFSNRATAAIQSRQVAPFVAVMPPITSTVPSRDTECVDVPGGVQPEWWLRHDVRSAVVKDFSVSPSHWSVAGFSTGGYCAANLLIRHPHDFQSAVSIAGYFAPGWDKNTRGNPLKNRPDLDHGNSPLWIYQHRPPRHANLLIVMSKADTMAWRGKSYANGEQMARVAGRVPGTSLLVLPQGGHHYAIYSPTIPSVLTWMGQHGL